MWAYTVEISGAVWRQEKCWLDLPGLVVTGWEGGLRLRLTRPAWRDVTSPDWSTELVALARPGNVPPNFLVPAHSPLGRITRQVPPDKN